MSVTAEAIFEIIFSEENDNNIIVHIYKYYMYKQVRSVDEIMLMSYFSCNFSLR